MPNLNETGSNPASAELDASTKPSDNDDYPFDPKRTIEAPLPDPSEEIRARSRDEEYVLRTKIFLERSLPFHEQTITRMESGVGVTPLPPPLPCP